MASFWLYRGKAACALAEYYQEEVQQKSHFYLTTTAFIVNSSADEANLLNNQKLQYSEKVAVSVG